MWMKEARILMKNKDVQKYRPIVNCAKDYAKRAGDVVSRTLTKVTNIMEQRWKTMNISDGKEVVRGIKE